VSRLPCGAVALALALVFAPTLLGCPAERRQPAVFPGAAVRLCNPHSVILVRHAEKAVVEAGERDPELSPRGHERAQRLATLLGNASITRLVATEYKRTQQTLAQLSQRIGKPVETSSAAHSNDLLRELRDAPPESTTVVATHSNVIPQLARDLGAGALSRLDPEGNLPENDFGRVLVLSVGCSTTPSLVELSSDP
jgi:broad specificity phosphatase PhoE